MGVCYTYLLYEDFDWCYSERSKDQVIEDLKKELPVAEILAQWSHYIVVDLDKNSPTNDNAQALRKYCDSAKYYTDMSEWSIQEVEFKHDKLSKTPVHKVDRRALFKNLKNETPKQ